MTSSTEGQSRGEVAGLRVAVTGASGFVGSHIALELKGAGAEAIGVVRNPGKASWLEQRGVALRRADLAEVGAMAEAFEGCDAVVANAALGSNQGSLDELVRGNTTGVRNTFAAAARAGVKRVVYISSVAVYNNRPLRWQTEDAPRVDTDAVAAGRRQLSVADLTTDWRYAHSKALAEDLAWSEAERLGLEVTSLRPGPVYGSRDPKLMPRLLKRLKLPVLPLPRVGMPLVHAADVALAVVGALGNPKSIGEAYNLSGPPTPLPEVFRELVRQGAAPGRAPIILCLPLPIWVGFDTSKAERDLGFRARSLKDGFAEALAEPA